VRIENPRVAHHPELQRWWERASRPLNSSVAAARHLQPARLGNYEPVLLAIRQPVLVLVRRNNRVWDIESSRATAALMHDARFVELLGSENEIFLGDTSAILAEIERFLATSSRSSRRRTGRRGRCRRAA
jgi:pimeloyl-ACP methyl ester carboxylesterase